MANILSTGFSWCTFTRERKVQRLFPCKVWTNHDKIENRNRGTRATEKMFMNKFMSLGRRCNAPGHDAPVTNYVIRFQLLTSLTASNCWWLLLSTHGLVRVKECPHWFWDTRYKKISFGLMKTKPLWFRRFWWAHLTAFSTEAITC